MTRQVTNLSVKELTVADGNWDTQRLAVNLVIIHTMVGTVNSANQRFNDPSAQVSAHYGVGYDGSIVHWVDEDNVAYHAGDYSVNQHSIGIEHVDNGQYNAPRPDALYTTSAKLVHDICKFYSIPIDRTHIKKHSEVHATQCPDALDIDRIVREAQQLDSVIITQPIANPVISNQTIIDLGEYGRYEVQAIRGFYADANNWKKDLDNANSANRVQADQIDKLQKDLTDCGKELSKYNSKPYTGPKTVDELDFSMPIISKLDQFLRWFFSKFK